jgi:hypothetical protein
MEAMRPLRIIGAYMRASAQEELAYRANFWISLLHSPPRFWRWRCCWALPGFSNAPCATTVARRVNWNGVSPIILRSAKLALKIIKSMVY